MFNYIQTVLTISIVKFEVNLIFSFSDPECTQIKG